MITITNTHKHRRVPKQRIIALTKMILKKESPRNLEHFHFVFLDNVTMRRFNKKFLNHDYPTDTITFDLSANRRASLEGECYISLDQAVMQAKEYGVTYTNEVLRLCAHCVLHLLGYHDDTDQQRSRMIRRGDHYLTLLEKQ